MANEGEFTSGGVTPVSSLLTASKNLEGKFFYLLEDNGGYSKGFYSIVDDGSSGYEWNRIDGPGRGKIYIANIEAAPGQTSKEVGADVSSSGGLVIEESTGNTNLIRVTVRAIGDSSYMPDGAIVAINGGIVDSGAIDFSGQIDGSGPEFEAFIDLNVGAASGAPYDVTITVNHIDGAADTALYHVVFGPVVTEATFVTEFEALGSGHGNEYPLNGWSGQQTEVKDGDQVYLHIVCDPAAPMMTGVTIYGEANGLFQNDVTDAFLDTYDTYIPVTVDNNTETSSAALRGFKVKAKKADNVYGEDFESTSSSNGELTQLLHTDISPTASAGSYAYPGSQTALKDSEQADLTISFSDGDSTRQPEAELIGSSLVIDTVPIISGTSLLVSRNSGAGSAGTLESTDNVRARCFRSSNGQISSWATFGVWIQDDLPVVTVSEATARLASSPSGLATLISISTDQNIGSLLPSITPDEGVMIGAVTGSGNNFSQNIRISDNDPRGVFTWQGVSVTNRAGRVQTAISGDNTYEIGGFSLRRILFTPAFSNNHDLGVAVADVGKLYTTDTGGFHLAYTASLADNPAGKTFTITGAGDNLLTVTDSSIVNQNATGTYFIDIQENP